MPEPKSKNLYRVTFLNQGHVYEVYAKSVSQDGFYGFVTIESLVFGEKTQHVIDPSEERLADEFADVVRSWIPMHEVVRIDEVSKRGTSKVRDAATGDNVMPFPVYTSGRNGPGKS